MSPLNRVWNFHDYLRTYFTTLDIKLDNNAIEYPQRPCKENREAIFRSTFNIMESKKHFFAKYTDMRTFEDDLLNEYDICIWSDESLSSKEPYLGSGGFVITDANNMILQELGESYFPVFSSFQSESLAMKNAMDNALKYDENVFEKKICILTDSQALLRHIKTLRFRDRVISPYILDILHIIAQAFKNGAYEINFTWIPGHSDITWNERADKLASKAYTADLNPYRPLIPVSALRSFAKKRTNIKFAMYLQNNVQNSAIDEYPDRTFYRKYKLCSKDFRMNNLKKIELRLRSGHNRLNKHLHRLHLHPDSSCRYCGAVEEEGLHILVYCQKIPGLHDLKKQDKR